MRCPSVMAVTTTGLRRPFRSACVAPGLFQALSPGARPGLIPGARPGRSFEAPSAVALRCGAVSTLATLSDIESAREQLINRRQRLDRRAAGGPGRPCRTPWSRRWPPWPTRFAWLGAGRPSRSRASSRPRPAGARRTATSARSRRASTRRSSPPPSSTPTRCSRRPDKRPRSARPSSASCWPFEVLTSGRCDVCWIWSPSSRRRPGSTWRYRRESSTGPRPNASRRAACTATTTTSRRPGPFSRRSSRPTPGTSATKRAVTYGRWACSCAAACSSAWARRSRTAWS